jgi:hypothetical protein
MNSQLMLQIAIQHPVIYGLATAQPNSAFKVNRNKARRKILEFAVMAFAGFINPDAANWAIPALKLCFMILDYLKKSQNK